MIGIQVKKRLKNGEPNAYKEVFRLLYPRLKRYCKLFIADEQDAEDIIQEGFLTLWEKRKKIQPEKSLESFLFVIIRNRCLNQIRKNKLEGQRELMDMSKLREIQFLYQIDFTGKEEKSLEELMLESFQQAIDDMPKKMKIVFTKCKIEGKKQKDVALELGITEKTIEKHISKAKQYIREKLLLQYPSFALLVLLFVDNIG